MDNVFDSMYYSRGELIGGLDESGVSDIAGPLVAACVVLPKIDLRRDDLRIFEVNDSKQIPERYRKQHANTVWQVAIGIGIGEVFPNEIDYLGKAASARLAMLRAVTACISTGKNKKTVRPDFLLVDGSFAFPGSIKVPIQGELIEKGDTKSLSIAAASIVAKVWRDERMVDLHESYPEYDWENNKGYPCENQFKGIDQSGAVIGIHRIRSWPFVPHERDAQNHKLWKHRRAKWRRRTEAKFGEGLWAE